ncbi:MAG: hypothetical protein RLZ35_851 [Pseudomonadota bacterium]|jgi:acid stress-induced BolA-like protein IbaG/YrbA
MITVAEVTALIQLALPDATVRVESDDSQHFDAVVISPSFTGKRPVQRQQLVYAALNDHLLSGRLHALALKTLTPEEYTGAL